VARATALIVGAVIALATFWLLSGMGFYLIDPVGDKPLVAVLFYTMMAVVILLIGRWVMRRI
jgi:chromate transport protein ChrA